MMIYAVVYFAAPNVEVPRFQPLTPGAVIGVVAWIVASGGFFFYVSSFSSYSATYGAFAGAVILLVWLWLTNVVLLLGAELNAVIDLRTVAELSRKYDGAAAAGEGPGGLLEPAPAPAGSSPSGHGRAWRGPGSRRRGRGAARRRRGGALRARPRRGW